jgi:hypothetical protein
LCLRFCFPSLSAFFFFCFVPSSLRNTDVFLDHLRPNIWPLSNPQGGSTPGIDDLRLADTLRRYIEGGPRLRMHRNTSEVSVLTLKEGVFFETKPPSDFIPVSATPMIPSTRQATASASRMLSTQM